MLAFPRDAAARASATALTTSVATTFTLRNHIHSQLGRVTWGFLSFLGVVSYRIRILMYSDVSCMYLDSILTCPIYVHQDTSRYIRIQLYL
jgi:hypothetical protein